MQPERRREQALERGDRAPTGTSGRASIATLVPVRSAGGKPARDEPGDPAGGRLGVVTSFPSPASPRTRGATASDPFAGTIGYRRRERRRWVHWLTGGTLMLLGGIALFIVGLFDASPLTVLGYLLLLAGVVVVLHASALHRFARARLGGGRRLRRRRGAGAQW